MVVAPFWADVDTREMGDVWYQECNDDATLARVSQQINSAFPLQVPFTAQDTFIATWDQVGYFDQQSTPVSTTQHQLTIMH